MQTKLKVVCTPIGNLQDITFRAAETLKHADIILCEDTRVSSKLLSYIGSTAKMLSCHQHNEEQRVTEVSERLLAGEHICLISDAGAPAISDPGGRLVEGLVELGHEVEVFPGPTAITALLMGAGIKSHPHVFLGFLPRKKNQLLNHVRAASVSGYAIVIYESPRRINKTLEYLFEAIGRRRIVVGRELTKRFECFHRGYLGEKLAPDIVEKGEFVLIIEAASKDESFENLTEEDKDKIAEEIHLEQGLKPKRKAKILAEKIGVSNREAYERLLKITEESC